MCAALCCAVLRMPHCMHRAPWAWARAWQRVAPAAIGQVRGGGGAAQGGSQPKPSITLRCPSSLLAAGLDSASAFYVMSSVRKLAEHCRTVVTVIHQPSSEVRGSRAQLYWLLPRARPCMRGDVLEDGRGKVCRKTSNWGHLVALLPAQVFELFDKLCLLSDGNVIFFGELLGRDARAPHAHPH